MTPGARIQAAIDILERLYAAWQAKKALPVDALFADYFKANRYMGSKDRATVSDLVYYALRNGGAIEWHLEQADKAANPRRVILLAAWFSGLVVKQASIEAMRTLFTGEKYMPSPLTDAEIGLLQKIEDLELLQESMPWAAKLNYPDWMEGRLKDAFGDEIEPNLLALNEQAPIDLRVNTLKCADRSDLILALDADGYFATPTPHSPLGVRLKKRLPAFNTKAFRDGKYEMQDEGSQMVALMVAAKPGQKVIDFCAGAGGKTLAIAATMQNKGRILAWDASEKRLKQLPKRLARAGVSNVQIHALRDEGDPFTKRHKASADWVLVDAPCSGSGTWRRNPDLKWRFTLEDLQEVKAIQQRILHKAAALVAPKGKLVYVTCSVFRDENILQVKQFLEDNPTFKVVSPGKMWDKHLHSEPGIGPVCILNPHKDGTDGFFAAILQQQG